MTTKSEKKLPPNAGKGKKPGTPNRTTKILKEAILLAAEKVGQDGKGKEGLTGYLVRLATKQPKSFATLLARVIPLQVTGEDGGSIVVTVKDYTGRKRDAAD